MFRRNGAKRFNDERGFTLIELMIVILVILVLAAILMPQFGLARERARKATCVSNQRNLETAVALWETDNPGPTLGQGEMSATSVPTAATLSTTPVYTPVSSYKEPDDTGVTQTNGADYFLSAGGTTPNSMAPSYGHVICIFAFAPGTNPDPWGGVGPAAEQGTAGAGLNHARGASASP
ncbi:MAG TPA: type II secretion system protein [bacterium]|nr:type II secretion system protein [bacterium]